MHRPRFRRVALSLAIFWLATQAALADQIEDEARKLLAAGNAAGALQVLIKHEPERAGNPQYDFLLGIAALDGGDPQRAVFALERVLALQPHNNLARAEIARAYFQLGERANAEREFRAVRDAADVPGPARTTIDRFLAVLAPSRTKLQGYVEVNGGHDSNVNSATRLTEIVFPLTGQTGQLNTDATRKSAPFAGLAAGASFSHDVTEEVALIASASGAGRFNHQQSAFNTAAFDGLMGLRQTLGANAVTLAVQGQHFRLDNNGFRNSGGYLGQWQHNFSRTTQGSAFVQEAQLRFPTQPQRDANRRIGGVALGQSVPTWSNAILFTSLYGGHEESRRQGGGDDPNDIGFRHFGNRPLGIRLGGEFDMPGVGRAYVISSWERRRYDAPEPALGAVRADYQTDIRIGLRHTLAPRWTLTPEFSQTRNRSNIDLYAYSRTIWMLSVRHDF